MVNICIFGFISSAIHRDLTGNGVPRTLFVIESADPDSLPLKYDAVLFGNKASAAECLQTGDELFLSGRLVSAKNHRITLIASTFERTAYAAQAPAQDQPAQQ
jgi:hypothetical protein